MRGIAVAVLVVLLQGCSSPQLTVVVPEHPLWDKNPTQKDAAQAGKLSRGEVYPGSCAAFCQIDHPSSGSQLWVYSGGLVPYPIVGEERTVQFAAALSANYDMNGSPTGTPLRTLAAGDKVVVADDLGGVPKNLSCVIEGGKVAGYVARRAVPSSTR